MAADWTIQPHSIADMTPCELCMFLEELGRNLVWGLLITGILFFAFGIGG